MKNEKIRLNPFVYISETDVRFYLLILIGITMPLYFTSGQIFAFLRSTGQYTDPFFRFFILLLIFFFILILIYAIYRRFPKKKINQLKLKTFNKPDHCKYIEKLNEEYLSNVKQPTVMYQPLDYSMGAFTFGTKEHIYIYIPGGLVRKFRSNINVFKSIFLHEMGHIANKDVEKAYLALSTWKSLFITPFIVFGYNILLKIIIIILLIFNIIIGGFNMDMITRHVGIVLSFPFLATSLYLITFLTTVYVLRNQIIRLREFYADARVLEWEKSPKDIIKTLEESGGKLYSKFEILNKFHPNTNERIKVLKNNLSLFTPNLWVAFALGFFYEINETYLMRLIAAMLGYYPSGYLYYLLKYSISIFIFTFIMLAVSSSFHKLILRDVFIENKMRFSFNTILNIVKFSLVFSLGLLTVFLLDTAYLAPTYEINEFIGHFYLHAIFSINDFIHFSLVLIFLVVFSSMLIQRSFSKKEANTNFFIITIFSSILFIFNSNYYINEAILMLFVFSLFFSVLFYIFIKIKNRKLYCPNCNNKILDLSGHKLNCPNCQYNLYSWAIYSF